MKLNDGVKARYDMHLVVRDKDGNIKEERLVKNTVTTYAREQVAAYMTSAGNTYKPAYMLVGIGTPGATGIGTPCTGAPARVAMTSAASSGAVLTLVASFAGATYTGALKEAATYTASSGTTCWTYATFSDITLGSTDTLTISWTITVS